MWEVVAIVMCLGAPAPDASNCVRITDNRGPYETQATCAFRIVEMKRDFPPVLAQTYGWRGPIAIVVAPVPCIDTSENA